MRNLLLGLLLALGAPAAWAQPLHDEEVVLPFVPISFELEQDGRIKWIRFVFVPAGLRKACQMKTLSECEMEAFRRNIQLHAKRKHEPERVITTKLGPGRLTPEQSELMRGISVQKAVKSLITRKDATWGAAGKGMEYPIDRRRFLKAKARWRVWADREELELLAVR